MKVSLRCGIPITEFDLQHPGGIWHWVWQHNVPVTIVERVKKAGALLTAGYAAIANSVELSQTELKKLQDKRAKTKTERHQQRKAELSRRYEVDVTPELVEKDDDGWYLQLRMHYYLTPGREFLTTRDAKRTKAQLEAGENSIWKPDFNKGQMLSSVLLLEELNLYAWGAVAFF